MNGKIRSVCRCYPDGNGSFRYCDACQLCQFIAHRLVGEVNIYRAAPWPTCRDALQFRLVERPVANNSPRSNGIVCRIECLDFIRVDLYFFGTHIRVSRIGGFCKQYAFAYIGSARNRILDPIRDIRPREENTGLVGSRLGSNRARIQSNFPDGVVHHKARFLTLRRRSFPTLYPNGYIIVMVVLQIFVGVPCECSRFAGHFQGETGRVYIPRCFLRTRYLEALHCERRSVAPSIGLLPFRSGFRKPTVIRNLHCLESEIERLLAVCPARRFIGVIDYDRCLTIQFATRCYRRYNQTIECAGYIHGIRPFAEIAVLYRVGVFVGRVIQPFPAPNGIALAPHTKLVVCSGLGITLQRHALKEIPLYPIIRLISTQAIAIPPVAPLSGAALPSATINRIIDAGRYRPPVNLLRVAVRRPMYAVPLKHDLVAAKRGRHVLRCRIRSQMVNIGECFAFYRRSIRTCAAKESDK